MFLRMFDEEYVEWENATTKCQELGARLPVLSDVETIKIVKKYLETAEFEVFEVKKKAGRILFPLVVTLLIYVQVGTARRRSVYSIPKSLSPVREDLIFLFSRSADILSSSLKKLHAYWGIVILNSGVGPKKRFRRRTERRLFLIF
jgi:hypothetical protein